MNKPVLHHRYQAGLTMMEVMVALTIGFIVTIVAAAIFTFSSKGFSVQQEQSRMQESGRVALDLLGRGLRNTSDFGCRSDWTVTKTAGFVNWLNASPGYAYDFGSNPLDKQLVGYAGTGSTWSPALPSDLTVPNTADQGSDIVTVRGITGNAAIVKAPFMALNTDAVTVNTSNGFAANDALLVTDCKMSTIFQVSGTPDTTGTLTHTAGGTPGNQDGTLPTLYGTGAEVYKLQTTTFYIAPSQFNSSTPSLWRIVGTNAAEELVENVEKMKITYGMDPSVGADNSKRDFSANYYIAANATGIDMSKVISVHINLLVRSPDDKVTTSKQTYTFNGASATANDYRLRSAFSATISLRNRTL